MKFFLPLFLLLSFASCSSEDGNNDTGSSNCQTYCEDTQKFCDGDDSKYDSFAKCLDVCATFIDDTESEGATTGNTLQCRMYHASVAKANPKVHCTHLTAESTPDTCQKVTTLCDTYCGEFFEQCRANFDLDFKNLQDCLNTCPSKIPVFTKTDDDKDTDTVNCRITQTTKNCKAAAVAPPSADAVCIQK